MSNEIFRLPDGTEVGTGNIESTPEVRALAEQTFRVYGEDRWKTPKQIEELLKGDRYKELRKRRSKRMRNQARLGKCNASATASASAQVRERAGLPDIVASDCHFYMNINGGQDNGSTLIDGYNWLKDKGIAPRQLQWAGKEYLFPDNVYSRRQVPIEWLDVADRMAVQFRGFEPYILPKKYDDFKIAVASALADDHPIVFAWHVGSNGMTLRNGYVQQGRGAGNHANCAHSAKWVGGSDLVHPDDMNSWGPSVDPLYGPKGSTWGDGGFGLFTMQDFFACRQYHEFWVLVSTTQENAADPLK